MSDTPTTTLLDQALFNLFTTALEGGINYWSECSAYHWASNQADVNGTGNEDIKGFYAVINEVEEEGEPEHRIDRNVLAKGYGLATSAAWRGRIRWSSEKPPIVWRSDTDWDFDADDADVIVQLGLFSDTRYG